MVLLVCRYVKLLVDFFCGHQAQVQAAEAAARFAQEMGFRVENWEENTKGAMEVCCVSASGGAKGHQRCQDGDAPMMPGAGPSGRRSATACCCAGLCWLGLYGRGQG